MVEGTGLASVSLSSFDLSAGIEMTAPYLPPCPLGLPRGTWVSSQIPSQDRHGEHQRVPMRWHQLDCLNTCPGDNHRLVVMYIMYFLYTE